MPVGRLAESGSVYVRSKQQADRISFTGYHCVECGSDGNGGPGVIESELAAVFEAHDALVAACDGGQLPLAEFVAAYGNFPTYALDMTKTAPNAAAVLRRFRGRIEFHRQVSQVLAGVGGGQGAMGVPEGAASFLGVAAFHRLRQLVARYPDLAAEGEMAGGGWRR